MGQISVVLRLALRGLDLIEPIQCPQLWEIAMSTSRRTGSHVLKPRAIKRIRQSEAAPRPQREPLRFPDPDPPVWKPLG
jgi:hypothetical protein